MWGMGTSGPATGRRVRGLRRPRLREATVQLHRPAWPGRWLRIGLAVCLAAALNAGAGNLVVADEGEDLDIALSLAGLLRSARAVLSANQELINDPALGDKGLSGEVVLKKVIDDYVAATGMDPRDLDPNSRKGRLMSAQMAAIVEVMDEHQSTINKPGLGFKGFVPAVFARLVNENFQVRVGDEAAIKVTAPRDLVRNRKALPDPWEDQIIEQQLKSPTWPRGQYYSAETSSSGRQAFRILIPEYYSEGCLSCHGELKGEIDWTGYPKEGGKLGEFGGVISITLYR